MADSIQPSAASDRTDQDVGLWKHLHDALRGLQFGTVTLIVQDGLVIQVDRTEKRRLTRNANRRP